MKYHFKLFLFLKIHFLSLYVPNFAQSDNSEIKNIIKEIEFSGKWYLIYKYDISDNTNYFALKRGYITLKSNISKQISVRYTQDITIDREGSDAGNVEIRMKYIYMKLKPFKNGFLNKSYVEFGLVHRPYVDFEQYINDYRSQGKMYIEKTGIVNTAGFGVLFGGLIGGKLSEKNVKRTGKYQIGKNGSYAIGIYNGGGYHNFENNKNKTVEGRLTLRPLPEILPSLQLTYSGIYGKGNTTTSPDFTMNLAALTYQNPVWVLTGQYYFGKGDYRGEYFDALGNAAVNKGYSFFGEFKMPKTAFALFGRYDVFYSNQISDYFRKGYFGGITYRFLKSKIFTCYGKDYTNSGKEQMFELVLDVVF